MEGADPKRDKSGTAETANVPGKPYKWKDSEGKELTRDQVSEVNKTSKGPQVILSRTHRNMLRRLLEIEVPAPDRSVYLKAMERKRWSFPIVGVAAARTGGTTRVALAGVAPIPWLLDGSLDDATPLPRNAYKVDVAIHKIDGYPYDYHRLLHTFRVKSRVKDVGIYRPRHSWTFTGDVRFKDPGR